METLIKEAVKRQVSYQYAQVLELKDGKEWEKVFNDLSDAIGFVSGISDRDDLLVTEVYVKVKVKRQN